MIVSRRDLVMVERWVEGMVTAWRNGPLKEIDLFVELIVVHALCFKERVMWKLAWIVFEDDEERTLPRRRVNSGRGVASVWKKPRILKKVSGKWRTLQMSSWNRRHWNFKSGEKSSKEKVRRQRSFWFGAENDGPDKVSHSKIKSVHFFSIFGASQF